VGEDLSEIGLQITRIGHGWGLFMHGWAKAEEFGAVRTPKPSSIAFEWTSSLESRWGFLYF